jgi:enamine deaminase RidA (YjgF/YER057c/UK114 family)
VFVAGQVAEDAQGDLVARGDLAAQARQAFANVGRALAEWRRWPSPAG